MMGSMTLPASSRVLEIPNTASDIAQYMNNEASANIMPAYSAIESKTIVARVCLGIVAMDPEKPLWYGLCEICISFDHAGTTFHPSDVEIPRSTAVKQNVVNPPDIGYYEGILGMKYTWVVDSTIIRLVMNETIIPRGPTEFHLKTSLTNAST